MVEPAAQRSFLKWPGSKYRILPHIIDVLPSDRSCLVEPFSGSATVFLNTDYPRAIINDINLDLITLFRLLQHNGQQFIDKAHELFETKTNDASFYYAMRDKFNRSRIIEDRALYFLYLNRHGYNGLCRYNQQGIYNVPFGRYKRVYFPETEMQKFAAKAQCAQFTCNDYTEMMKDIKQDMVVYCDPPYLPLTNTAYFSQYHGNVFAIKEHRTLVDWCEYLSTQGVYVVVSNHDTQQARQLYHLAQQKQIQAPRFLSCKGNMRKSVTEVIAIYDNKPSRTYA